MVNLPWFHGIPYLRKPPSLHPHFPAMYPYLLPMIRHVLLTRLAGQSFGVLPWPRLWVGERWWKQALPKYDVGPLPILVGGWATPLKNMSSSLGTIKFPRYGTKWSKPQTSIVIGIMNHSYWLRLKTNLAIKRASHCMVYVRSIYKI